MKEVIKRSDFYDVYEEIKDEVGVENMEKLYNLFRGQQVNFPLHLYKPESVKEYIAENPNAEVGKMLRKFGYSELL